MLKPREHAIEVGGVEMEVSQQAPDENSLHGEEDEAVVLLRQDELVDVLLPLHLALVVVDKAHRHFAPDRRAPGVGLLAAETELRVLAVELLEAESVHVVEVVFFQAAVIA